MVKRFIGMQVTAVEGYDHMNGQLLIQVVCKDNPVSVFMMSPAVGEKLIRAINQATAMVQRAQLPDKGTH